MADLQNHLVWLLRLLFTGAVAYVFVYGINQAFLSVRSLMVRRKANAAPPPPDPEVWPAVTVQLPVFNEPLVIGRLLDAVSALQYPAGLLDVQILDDSTDETKRLIDDRLAVWDHSKIRVKLMRRSVRTGYKAGALAESSPTGELVAIFDADFVPAPDFLLRTVPHFRDATVGCVQAAWGFLNRQENLYTRLQAIGLAGHFAVEQPARNGSGWMSAFNGTCGVWRASAIRAAGGWQADTLTEDLDLSMRAQLAGWKMVYLPDIQVPGELPADLSAVRTQQFRWSRGGAQTGRKLSWSLLRKPKPFGRRWQAFLQVNASSLWVFVLLAAISGMLLSMLPAVDGFLWWSGLGLLSLMASVAFVFFHVVSVRQAKLGYGDYLLIPVFLVLAAGWAPHLARAVVGGWLGLNTPFIRTPKTGGQSVPVSRMARQGLPELLIGTIVLMVILTRPVDPVTIGFQVMLSAGCLCNGILLMFPDMMRHNG